VVQALGRARRSRCSPRSAPPASPPGLATSALVGTVIGFAPARHRTVGVGAGDLQYRADGAAPGPAIATCRPSGLHRLPGRPDRDRADREGTSVPFALWLLPIFTPPAACRNRGGADDGDPATDVADCATATTSSTNIRAVILLPRVPHPARGCRPLADISRRLHPGDGGEPGCLWFDWSRSLDTRTSTSWSEAFRDDEGGAPPRPVRAFKAAQQDLPPHLAETPRIVTRKIDQDDWSELGDWPYHR